jgi:hypothetical protein
VNATVSVSLDGRGPSIGFSPADRERSLVAASEKKADVVEYPEGFDHVGLLVNEPPGRARLPFV